MTNIGDTIKEQKMLESLKVGEPVIMLDYGRGWDGDQYYLVKVTKRTPTRITIDRGGKVFTIYGESYPKVAKGFGRAPILIPANSENLEKYQRSLAIRKVKYYLYEFHKVTQSRAGFDKLHEADIHNLANVLEKYLATIDQVNLNAVER
jgi:hypothetical protein